MNFRAWCHTSTKAAKWFRKAAEQGQGHAGAQNHLGICYDDDGGNGVAEDKAEAAKWHRKAAEQARELSQFRFRLMELE